MLDLTINLTITAKAAQQALIALRPDSQLIISDPMTTTATTLPGPTSAHQQLTASQEYHQVLWTLTLHMLQRFYPGFFYQHQLDTAFGKALQQLPLISTALEITSNQDPLADFDRVMTRLDAIYLCHYHGLATAILNKSALTNYIQQLVADDYLVQAWLLLALAEKIDQPLDYQLDPQNLLDGDLLAYLYWLTHQFFLATDYLQQSLSPLRWLAASNQIKKFTPWVIAQQYADIAAEMAVCLCLVREQRTPEYQDLLNLVLTHQTANGTIIDPQLTSPNHDLHSTASGLLALASFGR